MLPRCTGRKLRRQFPIPALGLGLTQLVFLSRLRQFVLPEDFLPTPIKRGPADSYSPLHYLFLRPYHVKSAQRFLFHALPDGELAFSAF